MTSDERLDRAYWEGRWTQVLREHPDKIAGRRASAHLLTEAADLHPGRALDAGCGHGAEAVWLASRGWRVTAVDYSATALDLARSRASGHRRGRCRAHRVDRGRPHDLGATAGRLRPRAQPVRPCAGIRWRDGQAARGRCRARRDVAPGRPPPDRPRNRCSNRGCRTGAGLGRCRRRRSRSARLADRGRRGAATGRGRCGRRRGGARGLVRSGRLVRHSSRTGCDSALSRKACLPGRREPASEARDAGAECDHRGERPAIAFVWTQARQALQQTAAIGACSPYLAVARVTRPCQTVFIAAIVRPWRESGSRPVVGSPLEGCAGLV